MWAAIPLCTVIRTGGIMANNIQCHTPAAMVMGTRRPIAFAIWATTMGVVRPDDVLATIVPSRGVEVPLMGMMGRPMTIPSPVEVTGALKKGIPQAKGLDMA